METARRFRGLARIQLLGIKIPVAESRRSRLLGLALLSRERAGAGLLIPRCRSVHTFGMRFPLDLLFIDRNARVIEIRRNVPAGRVVRCEAADSVLELPSPGRVLIPDGSIGACFPRSKSWRRWLSARTTIRLANCSATT